MKRQTLFFQVVLASLIASACGDENNKIDVGQAEEDLTSVIADFYDFEWDGMLIASGGSVEYNINQQIRYTVGQLNGDNSLGRLDEIVISDVVVDGSTITYHCKMTVAWGYYFPPGSTYTFYMPKNMGTLSTFVTGYAETCFDFHDYEPNTGNGWYFYRPMQAACDRTNDDFSVMVATVGPTSGR